MDADRQRKAARKREERLRQLRVFVADRHGGQCLAESYETQKTRYAFCCAEGHHFMATAANVLHHGSWCPYCAGNRAIAGDRLVELIESRGGRWLEGDRTAGRHSQIQVRCERGHEFFLTLDWLKSSRLTWCPQCKQEDRRRDQHVELCEAARAMGHQLVSQQFVDRRIEVRFVCPIGHPWHASPDTFRRFGGCRVCRSLLEQVTQARKVSLDEHEDSVMSGSRSPMTRQGLRLIAALSPLLDLPREAREVTINAGQIRLLVMLDMARRTVADRDRARQFDGHDKPTVDARLQMLRRKGLVRPSDKDRYHDSADHRPTPTGKLLVQRLRGERPHADLIDALDRICALPIAKRESVANAAILSVLACVVTEPGVTASDVCSMDTRLGPRKTARFRLGWLERHGLIERLPRFNAGGHGNFNRYRATPAGSGWVGSLAPIHTA